MDARPPARAAAPGPLRLKEGGGCMALFGLPFLAAGMFLLAAALGIVPFENADEFPVWAPAVILLMGAVFSAVGGALALGRRWTTLDGARQKLVREWGLLVPMRSEERWIGDHDAVVLRRREGDSDTADTWPVALRRRSAASCPSPPGPTSPRRALRRRRWPATSASPWWTPRRPGPPRPPPDAPGRVSGSGSATATRRRPTSPAPREPEAR